MHAVFSYAPGEPTHGQTSTRATTATYVDEAPDQSLLYYPGELQLSATFTRATTATYVNEDGT